MEKSSDSKTSLMKLPESNPFIFKTILSILLVVLILVITVYFKPKNKKLKNNYI